MKIRIGLVLATLPAYSETFFRSLIKVVQESGEMEMSLYLDERSSDRTAIACKTRYRVFPELKRPSTIVNFLFAVFRVFILRPGAVYRLWKANRSSGFSVASNLKSLLLSVHILPARLDWIHFGFGTLAIQRENVAHAMRAKMAVSFRGFDHYVYPIKHPGCYRLTFSKADHIHVLSRAMQKTLIAQGVKTSRISVITPAIDSDFFAQPAFDSDLSEKVRFVTVSRLHWIKGLDLVIEAAALLKDKHIDFSLDVIGDGPDKERLLYAIHQLGLQGTVNLVGRLSPTAIQNRLAQSHVYIQYSVQEGFCNAVLEAQAMGLLCLVSDAEGLLENVLHQETGWVVPRRQPRVLADAMEAVIKLPASKRSEVRKKAVQRIRDEFDISFHRDKFLRFYLGQ